MHPPFAAPRGKDSGRGQEACLGGHGVFGYALDTIVFLQVPIHDGIAGPGNEANRAGRSPDGNALKHGPVALAVGEGDDEDGFGPVAGFGQEIRIGEFAGNPGEGVQCAARDDANFAGNFRVYVGTEICKAHRNGCAMTTLTERRYS